jgi:hypothetical protein
MLHIILISVALVCQLILLLVALSGIKFYILNSEVETAYKDAFLIKFITVGVFALACLSICAILII